jgi:hypothetical protein
MQKYLESLTALHSADLQAQGSRDLGRTVRREPVTTEHPLIRTNPVTGWKSVFFNPGFVTKIVGVPKTESDHIIALLTDIVATSPENHARFQWREGDVAFWDNRVTVPLPILISAPLPLFLPSYHFTLLRYILYISTHILTHHRITPQPTASHHTAAMQFASQSAPRNHISIRRVGVRRKRPVRDLACRERIRTGVGLLIIMTERSRRGWGSGRWFED